MDDRMADSEMLGNIQREAFDDGFKQGREETLKEVKEAIEKFEESWKFLTKKPNKKAMTYSSVNIRTKEIKELVEDWYKLKQILELKKDELS